MSITKDDTCPYCGSSLSVRFGNDYCTGDNLPETKSIFDSAIALEKVDPHTFGVKLDNLREDEFVFDLFMDYWSKIKKDPESGIRCIHKVNYFKDLRPASQEIPMPDPYIPFPDLAEVYIAEIMLGRELTNLEKDGSRYIPKIRDDGSFYFAPLKWITFPHSYMSENEGEGRIMDLEPLPKVFDIEDIRGRYAGRSGDKIDD